jgi:hypothetical protein
MSIVAPKVRKHLSADALLHLVRNGFAAIPDSRGEDVDISLTDALMSAFAMFSLKAPSLLTFDKERAEGNLHTIYGIPTVSPAKNSLVYFISIACIDRPVLRGPGQEAKRGEAGGHRITRPCEALGSLLLP